MNSRIVLLSLLIPMLLLGTLNCSIQPTTDAGSSVAGNARVFGSLCYSDGAPATNTQVSIIPADYNPLEDSLLPPSSMVSTDLKGGYSFTNTKEGIYNIYAADSAKNNVLIKSIQYFGNSVDVPSHTLNLAGIIKIILSDSVDQSEGYVYIPGTPVHATINSAINKHLIIEGIPADSMTNVTVVIDSVQETSQNVAVTPGDTVVMINPMWQYSMNLFLNTTPDGADIKNTQTGFPVLVRLESHNFNFKEAKPDGADIRFSKTDGTQLPYEIEKWDSENEFAEVWVKVDTISGNNEKQHIIMYWGNQGATSVSNSTDVFDTVSGFQGVWHLSEAYNDTVRDATANRLYGLPQFLQTENTRYTGTGRFFNGSGCIVMPNTVSSKLSIGNNSSFTVSSWVYSDIPGTTLEVVAGKGNEQYSLNLRFWMTDSRWEFVSRIDNSGQVLKPTIDNSQGHFGEWNYITGVGKGTDRFLYVNGKLVQAWTDTLNTLRMPEFVERKFSIGGLAANDADLKQNIYFFIGYIDEVRFSNVARSSEWIQLSYANQQRSKALVLFDRR